MFVDGTTLPATYRTAQEAQVPIENSVNKKLRWVPEGRVTGEESYRGEDPT